MNETEYEAKMTDLIGDLPPEWQEFIRMQSWEKGHSAGYYEVYNYALGFAYDIRQALTKQRKRVRADLCIIGYHTCADRIVSENII